MATGMMSKIPHTAPYLITSGSNGRINAGLNIPMLTAITLLTVGVFVADLMTVMGIAVWVFYLVPLAMSVNLWRPTAPIILAGVISIFLVIVLLTGDVSSGLEYIVQWNRAFALIAVWILTAFCYSFVNARINAKRENWLQSGRSGINSVMAGDQSVEVLSDNILRYLCELFAAPSAAIFVLNDGQFQRTGEYGIPSKAVLPKVVQPGDGIIGQAIREKHILILEDVPDGFQWIGSTTFTGKPRAVLACPSLFEGEVNSLIEINFLQADLQHYRDMMEVLQDSIAIAIRSANYRANLKQLLQETQRQAEELQVQSEELRVSNEELEEQSRALQESQVRLEQQQVELEQTNSQLETQATQLEKQRDEIRRASGDIEIKAHELERASRYKSAFLANMSHELRTPLNSTLILAKLLADNTEGNLNDSQVASAETILSAGNDLLNLINDILDLSKIEAGKMELRVEQFPIEHLTHDLAAAIRPLAEQKNLKLAVYEVPGTVTELETDRQRLEQILKNLLSNAIKFTDQGEISLTIAPGANNRVQFIVSDSGIGIAQDHLEAIFEAFRQVDSEANRRYSGTGLGLSISRQLARLLQGTLNVRSQLGKGSQFIVELPIVPAAEAMAGSQTPSGDLLQRSMLKSVPAERTSPLKSTSSAGLIPLSTDVKVVEGAVEVTPLLRDASQSQPRKMYSRASKINDDRETLNGNQHVILVVEDDLAFAKILYDLAREMRFQCIIATTAEEAVAAATQYLPSAVVLDVGLPDHSGLSVLDRLKNDSRTRHIPVHVVSAGDYTEAAMSLGAVGFISKPVTRVRLEDAFKGLENRLTQRMRRVLLVEDDKVQLESLKKLLGSHDVDTVGVSSVAECLDQLEKNTYDCMVLDLTLPDASGYSLLEKLSREDAYSFPPVIVYTGSDLSTDEEMKLRRYSKSIIIKGAKSPERLLDEVTLFLHQVVAELPQEQQTMIKVARSRESALEGRRILVVEDDVRNVFALTSILEPRGAVVQIARNGREALEALEIAKADPLLRVDLVLMDVMMPEMDGLTATREIRKDPIWKKLPIIVLTAKAMKEDQENCIAAGANDYMAKPLDVEKLLSLVRVWIRR